MERSNASELLLLFLNISLLSVSVFDVDCFLEPASGRLCGLFVWALKMTILVNLFMFLKCLWLVRERFVQAQNGLLWVWRSHAAATRLLDALVQLTVWWSLATSECGILPAGAGPWRALAAAYVPGFVALVCLCAVVALASCCCRSLPDEERREQEGVAEPLLGPVSV